MDASDDVKRQILVAFLGDFANTVSNEHIRKEILNARHYFKCSYQDVEGDSEPKLACSQCMVNKGIQVPSKSLIQDENSNYDLNSSNSTCKIMPSSILPTLRNTNSADLSRYVVDFFLEEASKVKGQYQFCVQIAHDMLERHGKVTDNHNEDCYPKPKKEFSDVGLQVIPKYSVKPWFTIQLCHYKPLIESLKANSTSKNKFFGHNLITTDDTAPVIPKRALDNKLIDPRNGSVHVEKAK